MRVSQTTLEIIVAFTIVSCSSAANIIILCLPGFSHLLGPVNVGKLLQKQGHNVSVAIIPKLRTKLELNALNLLIYHRLRDWNGVKELEEAVIGDLFYDQKNYFEKHLNFMKSLPHNILRDQQLLQDIQTQKPDLICLDPSPPGRMLAIIPYKLDIPFIFVGPFVQLQFSRSPFMASFIPNVFSDLTDQMTFSQRITNTFNQLSSYVFDPLSNSTIVQDYAPEKPYISMIDLQAKALLWIIGLHNVLSYNPPTMPNVKYVGHLISSQPKPLSQKFKDFADSAEYGVVVVSFGSILKSLPSAVFDKFLTAFKRTKYKFVIHYSRLNPSINSDQFLLSSWLPQYDLLHHKNTRLFVTHCGANGMHEAVLAGIPMVAFPAFAEQPHNAAMVVRKGFGLKLDIRTFDLDDLVSAIKEVINNPKYKVQTEKASAIMRAERVPPVEEAAFWINHVLTFGADHLRSFGQDIPLWQYWGLDVLAVCLLVWHIILFVLIKILCFSFCLCTCKKKEKFKTN